MKRARSLTSAVLLLVLLIPIAACAPGGPDVDAELVPVPTPDLSAAATSVQEQIGAARTELETRRDAGAPPEELAEAYGDLGLLYVLYDFLDAAEACFTNARRLQPEDFRWPYLTGYLAQVRGRLDAAAADLERSLELRADFPPALLRLGRARLEQGDPAAARPLFQRALELDPEAAAAHEGLGRAAAASGDDASAIEHFQRALELDPAASGIHYALGQAYRNTGDLEAARDHLSRAGDVSARIEDPLLNPLAALGESAQLFLVQAAEAMDDENYEVAAGAYRRAAQEEPENYLPYRGLAYSLEKLGDVEGAVAAMQEALDEGHAADPAEDRAERARAHAVLGGLHALAGREEQAVASYRRSLELEPDQPASRLKLGDALARSGAFEAALEQYDRVLQAVPQAEATVRVKRGTALINLGRGDEGLAELRRAVEADPDEPALRLRYAEALDFLGRGAEAAGQRRRAAELSGDAAGRAAVLARTAESEARRGALDAALADYGRALEIDPTLTAARYGRASILAHRGSYEEALADFRQVVQAEPRHAGARRGEIAALILAGRHGEARVRLNEALRLFSRDKGLALTQVRLLASSPDQRVRDGALAMQVAEKVYAADPSLPVRDALAMACAEAGRFQRAVELQEQVVAEAEQGGDPELVRWLRTKLDAYRNRRAWTAGSPQEIIALSQAPG